MWDLLDLMYQIAIRLAIRLLAVEWCFLALMLLRVAPGSLF
jgi:hypothetical protein